MGKLSGVYILFFKVLPNLFYKISQHKNLVNFYPPMCERIIILRLILSFLHKDRATTSHYKFIL